MGVAVALGKSVSSVKDNPLNIHPQDCRMLPVCSEWGAPDMPIGHARVSDADGTRIADPQRGRGQCLAVPSKIRDQIGDNIGS